MCCCFVHQLFCNWFSDINRFQLYCSLKFPAFFLLTVLINFCILGSFCVVLITVLFMNFFKSISSSILNQKKILLNRFQYISQQFSDKYLTVAATTVTNKRQPCKVLHNSCKKELLRYILSETCLTIYCEMESHLVDFFGQGCNLDVIFVIYNTSFIDETNLEN